MKRTIFTIFLFLLLVSGGAIVNVAVAWGCAAWVALPPARLTGIPDVYSRPPQDATDQLDDRWLARTDWKRTPPDQHWVYLITVESSSSVGLTRREFLEWRCWDSGNSRSWPSILPADPFARQVRSGWPMRSLLGGHLPEPMFQSLSDAPPDPPPGSGQPGNFRRRLRTVDAIDIGLRKPRAGERSGRDLPLAMIWPGFLLNTIFYAIFLWLLICGPFALRRLIRIKRGHCPKCRYDLRGDLQAGCPECGWNRQPEATA